VTPRIETGDPSRVLAELPSGLAQACIMAVPRQPAELTLAVVDELRRVLREDGSLWLLLDPRELASWRIEERGWRRQRLPAWFVPLSRARLGASRLILLSSSEDFFCESPARRLDAAAPAFASRSSRQRRRLEGCAEGRTDHAELVRRCILAGSASRACGCCGAARPAGVAPPRCRHGDARGRCLVIDPFHQPSSLTPVLAAQLGRSFFGIVGDRDRGPAR
jgi:hypothetical protein